MNFDRIKANFLAENIKEFIEFVHRQYHKNNQYLSNPDKLYRLKLIVEEYKLHIIADELIRINRFLYDENYTAILVKDFRKAIGIIGEYIDNNDGDLFIFTAKLYTLRSICNSFTNI